MLLDINHLCDLLKVLKLNFTRINDGITDSAGALYNFVLDHSLYAINIENVKTILAEEFELKTITSICHNSNRNVYENIAFALRVTETPTRVLKKKVPAALEKIPNTKTRVPSLSPKIMR